MWEKEVFLFLERRSDVPGEAKQKPAEGGVDRMWPESLNAGDRSRVSLGQVWLHAECRPGGASPEQFGFTLWTDSGGTIHSQMGSEWMWSRAMMRIFLGKEICLRPHCS